MEAAANADRVGVETWMDRLRFLSAKEQALILDILRELREGGESALLHSLWQLDFERKPVDIDTFLADPYYLGEIGPTVYKTWREELRYVCDPAAEVLEWIVTGSIGAGKSYVALLAMLYRGPYYLSCLRNPQVYYGLAPGSQIVFATFNVTRENAMSVDFLQLASFIDNSKYFLEHMPRARRNDRFVFPSKNIFIREGSRAAHAIGSNLFGFLLDEANFMQTPTKPTAEDAKLKDQAYQLYEASFSRLESRFHTYGHCPGFVGVLSSRAGRSSWLEGHIAEVKGKPRTHVSDYSVWEAKGREKFSPKTFRVAIGNAYRSSRVIDTIDPATKTVIASETLPEGQEIVDVPVDFYDAFRRDTEKALRDKAGVPTFGLSRLITQVESVHACIDRNRKHPFTVYEAILPLDDPNASLIKLMDWRSLVTIDRSAYKLKVRPAEPRVVHVDLASTGDAAGIACGHRFGYWTSTDYDATTGQVTETLRPRVWIDFMLRIKPTTGTQIDITKIVAFILNLRNFGFPLCKVTFDGWQSLMAVQIIQKAAQLSREGLSRADPLGELGAFQGAGVLSVDRDDRPYSLLRDSLTYWALSAYAYQPFVEEVLHLEHDRNKKKVDHPADGPVRSKDVSDAVCGVNWNLLTLTSAGMLPPPVDRGPLTGPVPLHEQMLYGIAGEAIMHDGIQAIHPPPTIRPAAPPGHEKPARHLGSGMGDLIQRIAQHGM